MEFKFSNNSYWTAIRNLRMSMFVLCISVASLGMLSHLLGITGVQETPVLIISALTILDCIIFGALVYFKKMSVGSAFMWYSITAELLQMFRIGYFTLAEGEHYGQVILANMVVSYTILLYVTFGFIQKAPSIVAFLCVVSFGFALYVHPEMFNSGTIITFVLVVMLTVLVAYVSKLTLERLQREKDEMLKTQNDLLSAFHMNKDQLLAYLQLCRNSNEDNIENFFSRLDKKSEYNLIKAVEKHQIDQKAKQTNFERKFPMLSETERDICELVMKGYTINEIAQQLGKSASNVSTVRGNIRRKFGLSPEEDLQEYIKKKVI